MAERLESWASYGDSSVRPNVTPGDAGRCLRLFCSLKSILTCTFDDTSVDLLLTGLAQYGNMIIYAAWKIALEQSN